MKFRLKKVREKLSTKDFPTNKVFQDPFASVNPSSENKILFVKTTFKTFTSFET